MKLTHVKHIGKPTRKTVSKRAYEPNDTKIKKVGPRASFFTTRLTKSKKNQR